MVLRSGAMWSLAEISVDSTPDILYTANITEEKQQLLGQLFDVLTSGSSLPEPQDGHDAAEASSGPLLSFEPFDSFLLTLGIESQTYRKACYRALDRHQRGQLDATDFVLGVGMMDPEASHQLGSDLLSRYSGDVRCRYIFSLYDTNQDGKIDFGEFLHMLKHIRSRRGQSTETQDLVVAAGNEAKNFIEREGERLSLSNFVRSVQAAVKGNSGFRGTSLLFRLPHPLPWSELTSAFRAGATQPDLKELLNLLSTSYSRTAQLRTTPQREGTAGRLGVGTESARKRATIRVRACFIDADSKQAVSAPWRVEAAKRVPVPSSSVVLLIDQSASQDPMLELADRCQKRLLTEFSETVGGRSFDLFSLSEWEPFCEAVSRCLLKDESLTRIDAPVKVFGDIHGQLPNLLEYFHFYGSPNRWSGDIEYMKYVFIGDYVDRGNYSLEVVVLLFSLKLLYPTRVLLLRGNHEDRSVNSQYGFLQECKERLGEQAGERVWGLINSVFDVMPLGGLISGRILCVHGGIGRTVNRLQDIEGIQRPLPDPKALEVTRDLLWSDPTESDLVHGIHANARGAEIVKFGPDRVLQFCAANDLDMIFRAHEVVEAGFELFAGGHLLTVFSATNYCAKFSNDGAILLVTDDLEVVPKIIKAKPVQVVQDCWQPPLLPPTPPRPRALGYEAPQGARLRLSFQEA